ncbi:MAG: hypothetical protein QOJ03_1104 [Frankiaceae bacterium]|nr:hypothetical protein [Frankiaceae bacterium]
MSARVSVRHRAGGRVRTALAAGATTAFAGWLSDRSASPSRWSRTNYRGRPVDLFGGPAATAGVLVACLVSSSAREGRGARTAPLLVAVTAAGLGLYDDLAGGAHARGLRGHLRALKHGQVTTGLVKMAGLAGAGLAAAALDSSERRGSATDVVIDAALVSGTANLVNLLDLRPGRALKVVGAAALPLATRRGGAETGVAELAAGLAATAAALLPADLAERRMAGDCGANALGALLGWTVAAAAGRRGRSTALAAVVGLTLVSEYVSFSAVIERTPVLAAADRWGRLPV